MTGEAKVTLANSCRGGVDRRPIVGRVVGCEAPKIEARASARRPSGRGGKGESTKGKGIVGNGTWVWDLPLVGVASARASVARGGDVV